MISLLQFFDNQVITLLCVFSFAEAKFCQGCSKTDQFSLNRKAYDSRFSAL